ncbi:ADP-ribosylglycohydrolase family protein [Candidatus Nanosynbacter sp. TM7-087]|uniref:ADP-ribosylglycohydrolase family protein n=1 Tax=Candidatus Nanosynbacter sp. TM7-087 TaxID=2902631 RepID=UPI0033653E2D
MPLRYWDSIRKAEAIIAAANHDGDSDSTAAITGNIVGARVGYKNIPDYYKDNIELKDVILELADDMAKICRSKRLTTDTLNRQTNGWINIYTWKRKIRVRRALLIDEVSTKISKI